MDVPAVWPTLAFTIRVLALFAVLYLLRIAARCLDLYSPPSESRKFYGLVTIPENEVWSVVLSSGEVSKLHGPKVALVFGARLREARLVTASEAQYIEVHFLDGHTEIHTGPTAVREDSLLHKTVIVKDAVKLSGSEMLVVYRVNDRAKADASSCSLARSLIRGPCLYVPCDAGEYVHEFSWHGHDGSADPHGIARKRPNALRFTKLRATPMQTYFDVENARTNDDALLTIRLMIFYRIADVERLLDATNDPIAELINALSSDVIEFAAAGSFETFKESAEQLNNLNVYRNLLERTKLIGLEVSKVVFRGYIAPQRLQKMQDDSIERRTRLVLEREATLQEQALADERLAKEQERARTEHEMAKERAQHEAELQRTAFEAEQHERRARAQQEHELKRAAHEEEVAHLEQLKTTLGLNERDMAAYMQARAHGAPQKLIQIVGAADGQGRAPSVQLKADA